MKRIGRDTYIDGSLEIEGRLTSRLPDGGLSPLQVLSKVLNVNLNAEFVGGYRAIEFPRKAENANITGNYTFANAPTISTPSTAPTAAARYDQITALSGSYVPLTRTLTAGPGIGPIGDLSVNRTIGLDLAYTDARYALSASTPSEISVTDFNTPTGFKVLRAAAGVTTNQPSASNWGSGWQASTNNDSNHIHQLVFDINGGLHARTKYITWGSWEQIATRPHVAATYVPLTRNITVNGTSGRISSSAGAQSLAADRTWTLDLVASGVAAGTGTKFVVDTYGRITSIVAATTLAAYGITDAVSSTSIAGTLNYIPVFTGAGAIGNSPMSVSGGVVTSTGKIVGTTLESNSAAHATNINGLSLSNAGSLRWGIGKRGTESGANSGSDLWIFSADDSGNYLSNPIVISRATGNISFSGVLTVSTGNTSTQWNTAYSWGNHAGLYVPVARTVTAGTGLSGGGALSGNITLSLNTTYSDARYLMLTGGTMTGDLYVNDSKIRGGSTGMVISKNGGTALVVIRPNGDVSTTNQTSFNGSGPGITTTGGNSDQWNTAYGWGTHTGLYVPLARTITAGTGLSGGGALSGNITLSLASGVVTPGTYQKITLDTYGRGIAGANLNSADIITALGYTPGSGSGTIGGGGTSGYVAVFQSGGINIQNSRLYDSGSGRVATVSGAGFQSAGDILAGGDIDCGVNTLYGNKVATNVAEFANTLVVGGSSIGSGLAFEVRGTTKASMPFPKMTRAQRLALSPSEAHFVYQNEVVGASARGVKYYDGTVWQHIDFNTGAA